MKTIITLISLFIIGFSAFDQEYNNDFFCVEQIDTTEIEKIENKFTSQKHNVSYSISFSDDYVPIAKQLKQEVGQPIIYTRIDANSIFGLKINYFYSRIDLKVKLITYTWDSFKDISQINSTIRNRIDTISLEKELNIEYDSLQNIFNERFGEPYSENGEPILKNDGNQQWITRKTIWKTAKTNIELFLLTATEGQSFGTNRIRVKIYWDL